MELPVPMSVSDAAADDISPPLRYEGSGSFPPAPSTASSGTNEPKQAKTGRDRSNSSMSKESIKDFVSKLGIDTSSLDNLLSRIQSRLEDHDYELEKVHKLEEAAGEYDVEE